jgi:predicted PurR-regulated permease PerM
MTHAESAGRTAVMETKVIEDYKIDTEKLNSTVIELAIRLAFLGLLLFFSLAIIRPFIETIIWSVILAVALYPVFSLVAKWLGGRRRLAAALVTILLLLIVFGPVAWLGLDLVGVLRTIYERLGAGAITIPPPVETIKKWPLVGEQLFQFWELASSNLKEALVKVSPQLKPLGGSLLAAAGSAGTGILQFFASVIIAGFLLSPGPSLVEAGAAFLRRLVSKRGDEFLQLAGATIRNVSQGVIGVSILQALLAGIGLMAANVPGAGLITFLVLILGIIQIGPSVILIPVIIWSWMTMETTSALIFTAYMVPVNLVDNILRPIIMTRGLTTPMLVIVIGAVGGTLSNGIVGLFVGPVVLAVAWDLLVTWVREKDTVST